MTQAKGRTRIKKISVSIVFIGILAFPIFLEKSVETTGPSEISIDTVAALAKFGFYLEEFSSASFVQFEHKSPRLDPLFEPILPQIASMGASVSVVDFDRDGWNDFYVTNSRYGSKNALFHNLRNGSFEDVAESMGLANLNQHGTGVSMGSIWADINNDGFEDLFVYKWGKPVLFKNERGTGFTELSANSGLPEWINANTAIWFDYDSDGFIDLFIGGYFPEDLESLGTRNIKRTDGELRVFPEWGQELPAEKYGKRILQGCDKRKRTWIHTLDTGSRGY